MDLKFAFCNICSTKFSTQNNAVVFSCGHSLCLNCLSFFVLNIPKLKLIQSLSQTQDYQCSFCQNGIISNISEQLFALSKNIFSKQKEELVKCFCGNNNSEMFCEDCQIVLCSSCLQQKHKFHKSLRSKDLTYDPISTEIQFNNSFKFFENIEKTLNEKSIKLLKEFSTNIDKLIKILEGFKEKFKENVKNEQEKILKETSLIKNIFASFIKNVNIASNNLSPNKIFQLNKFLKSPSFLESNFEIMIPDFQNLKEMSLSLTNLNLFSKKLFELKNIEAINKLKQIDNFDFVSDPFKLQSSEFLNSIRFECGSWVKSKKFIGFKKENEGYLAWLGEGIQIFNLSKGKIQIVLKNLKPEILEFLDVLSPELLYCGGSAGVFRGWSLNDFSPIINIETGSEILSGVVLKDIYNEINNDYIIVISFTDKINPVKIYNKKGDILRAISLKENKYENKYCPSLSYYQDSSEQKTFLLMGISKVAVKIYDLKKETFVKEFKSRSHINSINYIRMEGFKFFDHMIYTNQTGEMILINLKEGKILNETKIENSLRIWDLCVWNEDFSFVSANDNTIKLISNKNLKVIKSFKTNDSVINLMKMKDSQGKEALFGIQDNKKIIILK